MNQDSTPPLAEADVPSGYTERFNEKFNGTVAEVSVILGDKVYAASGATGAAAFSNTNQETATHIALVGLEKPSHSTLAVLF